GPSSSPDSAARSTGTDRKRSFGRGIFAGVVSTFLVAVVTAFASALYYVVTDIPVDLSGPNSREWLVAQLFGFVSPVAGGAATARWSDPRSWAAPATYALIVLFLISFAPLPAVDSLPRQVIWVLQWPMGVLLGAFLYMRHDFESSDEA